MDRGTVRGSLWAATAALGALGISVTPACSRPGGAELAPPPARVEPRRLVLDRIPFGSVGLGTYRIANTGPQPLVIRQIGPADCTCVELELELPQGPAGPGKVRADPAGMHVELASGAVAALHLKLNAARFRDPKSRKIGSFVLAFEGFAPLVLEYAADIWTPFWVEPWAVDLGTVGARDRPTARVMVRGHDVEEFALLAPDEMEGWSLQATRVDQPGPALWRVDVTAPPELPLGGFGQEFRLATDLPGAPPVRFVVQGFAEPDVAWTPRRLLFPPGERPRAVDILVRARPEGLRLALPQSELEGEGAPLLAVSVEPVEPERVFRVRVTCSGPEPERALAGKLLLRTGCPELPTIEVPYHILPGPRTAPQG